MKNYSVWKDLYHEAVTFKDLDNLIADLTTDEEEKLYQALKVVKEYTGIDIKQEFLLGILEYISTQKKGNH